MRIKIVKFLNEDDCVINQNFFVAVRCEVKSEHKQGLVSFLHGPLSRTELSVIETVDCNHNIDMTFIQFEAISPIVDSHRLRLML